MQDVDREKETETAREKPSAEIAFGRKARDISQQQFAKGIANDQAQPKPRTGFTKQRHRAPQPRLKRKLRFDDPGI
jgi:hypothetical protein